MPLIYGRNTSGAIKKAAKLTPEKKPPGRVVIKCAQLRVIELSSLGFNLQRRRAKDVWVNVCFKSRRDDAIAAYNRQLGLVDPSNLFKSNRE